MTATKMGIAKRIEYEIQDQCIKYANQDLKYGDYGRSRHHLLH